MGLTASSEDPFLSQPWAAVYRSLPHPVFLVTDTGACQWANTQACTLLGFTQDPLVQAPLLCVAPVLCRADIQLRMRQLAPDQVIRLVDVWQIADGATITVDMAISKVDNTPYATPSTPTRQSIFVVCVIPANPQQASLEALRLELRERNGDLKHVQQALHFANAMQARFLSTVSHELRTPLHTLLGYVRLALASSSGELHTFLEVAERSGRQLATQISDLLRFNRAGVPRYALDPAPVCLPELLAQLARAAKLMAVAGHNRSHNDIAHDLPMWVSTDSARLEQAVANLLSNAFKYTSGGDVTLRVESLATPAHLDAVGSRAVRFTVLDTGTGIAAHDLPHIFDPFVRSPQAHFVPGQGLGLAIARQWVRALGGDIVVESRVGAGSTFGFDLLLPLHAIGAQPSVIATASEVGMLFNQPAHAPTIMVVDDVDENRMLLRRICERWGCHVVEAESAAQALAYAARPGTQVDMYMLDQCMPVLDGWALLARLREIRRTRAIPIAMVSASPPLRPADFPAYLEFDLFLEKPLDTLRLHRFLSERLAHFPQAAALRTPSTPPMQASPLPFLFAVSIEDWEYLRHLLHMGRVVRIAEWARKQQSTDPAATDFYAQLIALAEAADLVGLGRLINRQSDTTYPGDL